MDAAPGKNEPIVKLLLDSKYAAPTGNLVHIAVLNGWKDIPKLVASSNASLLNWTDDTTGNTALHLTVEKEDPDMVEALLAVKADPNLETRRLDMDGLTPLLRACKMAFKGGHDTAKLVRGVLSKRGADIDLNAKLPGSDGGRAKSSEEEKRSDEKAKDELHEESDELHDELLKLLLDFGADPNLKDATGSTPLLLAAGAGHIKALGALLDHNADPNINDTGGSTALHRAAQSGCVACMNLLVKKGANMNAVKLDDDADRGSWGFTPPVLAIAHRQLSAVKALLRLGADIGRAVHGAALCGGLDMSKTVHGKCPDPYIFDSGLGTPLCLAVTAETKDVASCLLENPKVATSIANPIGQTPLTIAVILGN
ncbi:Ankyrin [Metarhizium acridum CQMa 102]|uniref:Ankyrin n=1 Tax=Metarhizium acridum (strain CQMa 102) TaxID=655827 RepID=E9DX91_METAQ|nr:Ankyrin [Metarhizium acridum CQMa 102]EFY91649.1 Ankyrin [Metarhizium acridum CQMa 102]